MFRNFTHGTSLRKSSVDANKVQLLKDMTAFDLGTLLAVSILCTSETSSAIICGCYCFKDLRTVDGVECDTYHEACLAFGLLENDNQLYETLKEASESDSPSKIRALFAVILSFCEP